MTKQRIKVPLAQITTRSEAEQLLNSLAASANAKRGLAAEMDAKILAVQKKYDSGLATSA